MDNQHKKIKGYRNLSEMEIELMNDLKWLESKVLRAFSVTTPDVTAVQLQELRTAWFDQLKEIGAMRQAETDSLLEGGFGELTLEQLNESKRCLNESRRNFKLILFPFSQMETTVQSIVNQAAMWAVRAVALPDQLESKEVKPVEKDASTMQEEIYSEYSEKGSMAHESITVKLEALAVFDQAISDETLIVLESRGF